MNGFSRIISQKAIEFSVTIAIVLLEITVTVLIIGEPPYSNVYSAGSSLLGSRNNDVFQRGFGVLLLCQSALG